MPRRAKESRTPWATDWNLINASGPQAASSNRFKSACASAVLPASRLLDMSGRASDHFPYCFQFQSLVEFFIPSSCCLPQQERSGPNCKSHQKMIEESNAYGPSHRAKEWLGFQTNLRKGPWFWPEWPIAGCNASPALLFAYESIPPKLRTRLAAVSLVPWLRVKPTVKPTKNGTPCLSTWAYPAALAVTCSETIGILSVLSEQNQTLSTKLVLNNVSTNISRHPQIYHKLILSTLHSDCKPLRIHQPVVACGPWWHDGSYSSRVQAHNVRELIKHSSHFKMVKCLTREV